MADCSDSGGTAPRTHSLSVTWSSWPHDWARGDLLSTLAVFYDEVSLPYPLNLASDARTLTMVEGTHWESGRFLAEGLTALHDQYESWRDQWRLLFERGIINHLSEPRLDERAVKVISDAYRGIHGTSPDQYESMLGHVPREWITALMRLSQLAHQLCGESRAPSLLISSRSDPSTARLAGVIAHTIFEYQLPFLNKLQPEQVLEIREHTAEAREGFRAYVYQRTNELERRIASGEQELVAARKIVEREVIPEYLEMRRVLESKKVGFWANVLAVGGSFLQVDAAPWTPKFYGALLECFGVALGKLPAEIANELETNKGQMVQFLGRARKASSSGRGAT